ncbi:terpene synthase family protein [Streptomyces sp. NPDC000151]|uniref:terpene synthase family protein n=1 Tax=Streptomyces sp. NPDC000151 TaxID=3154244 RepID=UPI00331DEF59
MIPSGIVDDAFSRPGVQESVRAAARLRDRYLRVVDGEQAGDDFPAGRMLGDAMALAIPQMTPAVARRYRDAYRDILHSAVQEAEERKDGSLPDFATYMQGRRTNLFGYWATIQTEFALGLDLGRKLDESEDLALVRDLTIDHMVLVNDLYSFPKEYDAREVMNAVWIFVVREGRALQQAIDRLAELIGEVEDAFVAARRRIAEGPLAGRADISRYVTELGHLISGNVYYHQRTTRYHGDEHGGQRVAATRVATVRRPTVHS